MEADFWQKRGMPKNGVKLEHWHIQCTAVTNWSMPGKLRVEYPGAIYHIMSRGDRREDVLFGAHGIREDNAAGRKQFEERMEWRRRAEADDAEWEPLKRGWCIGSEEFRKQMLEKMEEALGDHHSGELRQER